MKHFAPCLLAALLLAACTSRPNVTLPAGAESATVRLDPLSNGFKLTATGGLIKLVNRKDDRTVYAAAPEMVFTPSGQVAAAADNSLTLDPSLVVSSPQRSTLRLCDDGTVTIRSESGKQSVLGKLLLIWFPHPDKLKTGANDFFEATPEAGEPQSFSPQGKGICL